MSSIKYSNEERGELSIHAFFDTRKGHQKQTQAVLEALANLTPTHITEHRLPFPSRTERFVDWLRYFISSLPSTNQKNTYRGADIIIGTGSRCHIPMLLAGRSCSNKGVKIITCMSPEQVLIKKFDLCLVPENTRIANTNADNILITTGPPCPVSNQNAHNPRRGLILLGGLDEKSHYWQTQIVVEQITKIIEKTPSISWTLSSSPRTPSDTVLACEKLCRHNHDNAKFFRSEDTGNGWIENQYSKSKMVWVTADSVSMVYEALSAGCQVGVLPVKWKKKNCKFARNLSSLSENNYITGFDDWAAGHSLKNQTLVLAEAKRCANIILKRWWPEKLQ